MRKQITIDFNQVDANLSNFPVLINLATDAELAANAQADGDDILFTLFDETTKISHEIEFFDAGNGTVANAQLDINADAVWALLFSVKLP